MDRNFNDADNQGYNPNLPTNSQRQVQLPQQKHISFMDYFKNNKWKVIGALVILIILIWFFCFRKRTSVSHTSGTDGTSKVSSTKFNVTKTRVGPSSLY
jgi:hypothetical protein